MSDLSRHDHKWLRRFLLGATLMIVVNLVPLYLTWKAWHTDGVETIGWPLSFYARGGFSYHVDDWPNRFVVDMVALLIAAKQFGDLTHGGFKATIHRLRTWGTPAG